MASEQIPELIPVVSSNVESIGYDEEEQEMYVKFHHGGTYAYRNVPHNVFEDSFRSSSIGRYIHNIIASGYEFRRVE